METDRYRERHGEAGGHASRRILFLDQTGEMGGAELSLLDLVRHRRKGAKVLLLVDGPLRQRLEEEGIAVMVAHDEPGVVRVDRRAGLSAALKAAPGLARLVRWVVCEARDADLVYANTQKAFVVGVAAAALARKPLIWHLRDILTVDHFSPPLRGAATRLANLGAARVIANSHATAHAFVEAGGHRSKIRVIHCGIDPAPFDNVNAAGAQAGLRRALGCGTAPLVGVFSRLAAWKGQHILIQALQAILEPHAVLVGAPLFCEQDYEARLHRMVEEAGLGGRVHFLGFRDDVPMLMKGVDIMLHTSIAPEPFGRVLVEGMFAERPVIATAAGGAPEIVDHGVTGLLVPPNDPGALAAAIREILADPVRSAVMARQGRAKALRRFSLPACVRGVDDVIAEVAAGAARAGAGSRPW